MASDALMLSQSDADTLGELINWWNRTRGEPAPWMRAAPQRMRSDRRMNGTLAAAMSSTAASANATAVENVIGVSATTGSTETVEVFNPLSLSGRSGAAVKFEWVYSSSRWEYTEVADVRESCKLSFAGTANGLEVSSTGSSKLTPTIVSATTEFSISSYKLRIHRAGTYALDWQVSVVGSKAIPPAYTVFTASVGGAAGASAEGHYHATATSTSLGDGALTLVDQFTVSSTALPADVTFKLLSAGGSTFFGVGGSQDSTCRVVRIR